MFECLKNTKKIVIKIGTSILSKKSGGFSVAMHEKICTEILKLIKEGKELVLVSSGSIALGMKTLGFKERPKQMDKLQACAAIGQGKLMHAYESFFSKHGLHTAQLLLTRDGLENRKRFLRARDTLSALLKMRILPIVNENDTVAIEEIAFGDNDVLSVQIAHLISADILVNLSDVEGFFLKDGSRVREVPSEDHINNKLIMHLKDKKKEETVGGMRAKLEAAKQAMKLDIPFLIVNGHKSGVIQNVLAGGDEGTLFIPSKVKKNSKQKWIAFSAARHGSLVLDKGAFDALVNKKRSLLPGGILRAKGTFEKGQVVELETEKGHVFGRGIVKYSSKDINKISGKKTGEIVGILGHKSCDEVIHRNALVLWGSIREGKNTDERK